MKNLFRISVLVLLAGLFCGCASPEPEPVARSSGDGSTTESSGSPAVDSNRDLDADNSMAASNDSDPAALTETSESPESLASTVTSNPSADLARKDSDDGGDARTDRDTDPPEDMESAVSSKSPPVIPSGEIGTDLGDTIPPIKGKDIERINFQLSDYDGKVLMIDFWGDW